MQFLQNLVNAFPSGCFFPTSKKDITQIKSRLNQLLIWSITAPINASFKLELQTAIAEVNTQLEVDPFSCCDTLQVLQTLEVVLNKMVLALSLGTSQQVNLLNLLLQLQANFTQYIVCLTCKPFFVYVVYEDSNDVSVIATVSVGGGLYNIAIQ